MLLILNKRSQGRGPETHFILSYIIFKKKSLSLLFSETAWWIFMEHRANYS